MCPQNEKARQGGPAREPQFPGGPSLAKDGKYPCIRTKRAGCRGISSEGEGHFFVGHPDVVMEL